MGFFDGGAKSMSFGKMGDNTWLNRLRGGVITNVSDERVQTDWKTGNPNPNGKTQVVVTTQCVGGGPLLRAAYASDPAVKALIDQVGAPVDERTDPSDDGRRGVYVKGNMRWDIGNKLRELNVREPVAGGELYLMFTGTRQTPSGDGRTYTVLYFQPAAGSVAGGFYDQSTQQAAPAGPPAQQGNAYGFGHQPPASPGGQAFAAQQSGPPAFGGGAPAQQPAAAPFGPPASADPFGAAPAAQQGSQPQQTPAPQAGPAQSSSPWG